MSETAFRALKIVIAMQICSRLNHLIGIAWYATLQKVHYVKSLIGEIFSTDDNDLYNTLLKMLRSTSGTNDHDVQPGNTIMGAAKTPRNYCNDNVLID